MSDFYNSVVEELQPQLNWPLNVETLLNETFHLGTFLNLSSRCIFKAIQFARKFLTNYEGKFDEILICQTAIFIACKRENIHCDAKNIHKCAGGVFKFSGANPRPDVGKFETDLFACRKYMESKLESEPNFGDAFEHVTKTVNKLPNFNSSHAKDYELARVAHILADGSITKQSICLNYGFDLVAYSCIELAIEVLKHRISQCNWSQDESTIRKVRNLKLEFSGCFNETPSLFRVFFGKDQDLYSKVYKITAPDSLWNEELMSRVTCRQENPLHSEPMETTSESDIPLDLSAPSARPILPDLREQTSHADRVGETVEIGGNLV